MKEIMNRNNKFQLHGYQEWYYINGVLYLKGFYNNDIVVDYEELYYNNGELENKNFYI